MVVKYRLQLQKSTVKVTGSPITRSIMDKLEKSMTNPNEARLEEVIRNPTTVP